MSLFMTACNTNDTFCLTSPFSSMIKANMHAYMHTFLPGTYGTLYKSRNIISSILARAIITLIKKLKDYLMTLRECFSVFKVYIVFMQCPLSYAGWPVNEANHSPTHVGTSPLQFPD